MTCTRRWSVSAARPRRRTLSTHAADPHAAPETAWGHEPRSGERHPHQWGFRDTRFEFCGPRTVRLTGDRYSLAGAPLPDFIPFVEDILEVSLDPSHLRDPETPAGLPPPARNEAFVRALRERLPAERTSEADRDRLVHSHGQLSVDEVYRILRGRAPPRLVDLVVWPTSHEEVVELVRLADGHDAVLIPYGGGTNVTGALLCPEDEGRTIVSVDMRRMDRILEIDRPNRRAWVEAGITGRELERRLEAEGYTCGHVPDSVEFSTLGGWIATAASGMKRNRYGNIEEIVLQADLVAPAGEVSTRPVAPRTSVGIQPRGLLFGSEGGLGIVTRAMIQLHALPEVRRYASVVLPSFRAGIEYLKAVQGAGLRPASIRLANNAEFRLGRALGPPPSNGWPSLVSGLKRWYVLSWKGFDPKRMVACTLVQEGTSEEVRDQARRLSRIARRFGGLPGGSEGGRRGYDLTFAIAYIRDFLNRFDIIGETFETSAPWDRIEPICQAVEAELRRLCAARGVPGRPYLSYRISQTYDTGVCIYFTMGFCGRGLERPDDVYQEIERRLREAILEQGGSLSHHHGVGKIRSRYLARTHSEAALRAIRGVKRALDPHDVFAARNHAFAREATATAPTRSD